MANDNSAAGGNMGKMKLSFDDLITQYAALQSELTGKVKALGSSPCTANPGTFLLLQFRYSQITQVGESISNLIAQVNSLINRAVQQQAKQ